MEFTKLQCELNIEGVTLANAGDLKVIDLSDRPYAGGVSRVCVGFTGVDADTTVVLTVAGNTAADGSGTDYVVATKSFASGDPISGVLEVDSTQIGEATDTVQIKSIVVSVTGTVAGPGFVIVDPLDKYLGLTPNSPLA